MKRTSLALSILLILFAGGVWGDEDEFPIQLTCQLGFLFFQLHLENDENKSWYKFLRESNEYPIEQLKNGTSLKKGAFRFFEGYKKRKIDDYFDVPHFRIRILKIKKDSIKVFYRAVSKRKTSWLDINRLTGELATTTPLSTGLQHFFPTNQGNCKNGLLTELPVFPPVIERKF